MLVVLRRGRYQTEARQVIRMWGQFYLEGNGRTQISRMKNIINIYSKSGPKNTFVDKTTAKWILPTAKVVLHLLTETKARYIQLLKICVKTLCAQLQLSPKGPDQEKQRTASLLLRIKGVTQKKQSKSGISYLYSCFKQQMLLAA